MFGKEEIKKLQEKVDDLIENIKTLAERQNSQYTDIMMQLKKVEGTRSDDEIYEDALEALKDMGIASTSFIQRMLGIGYARSVKIIDQLEQEGVIGPAQGSKPREVLIKKDD